MTHYLYMWLDPKRKLLVTATTVAPAATVIDGVAEREAHAALDLVHLAGDRDPARRRQCL